MHTISPAGYSHPPPLAYTLFLSRGGGVGSCTHWVMSPLQDFSYVMREFRVFYIQMPNGCLLSDVVRLVRVRVVKVRVVKVRW